MREETENVLFKMLEDINTKLQTEINVSEGRCISINGMILA